MYNVFEIAYDVNSSKAKLFFADRTSLMILECCLYSLYDTKFKLINHFTIYFNTDEKSESEKK